MGKDQTPMTDVEEMKVQIEFQELQIKELSEQNLVLANLMQTQVSKMLEMIDAMDKAALNMGAIQKLVLLNKVAIQELINADRRAETVRKIINDDEDHINTEPLSEAFKIIETIFKEANKKPNEKGDDKK